MARDTVYPANPHALYDEHGYAPAVRAGGLLFVSGQVGARADGTPEPELEDEVRLAFRNLGDILAAAGCTFDDVVDITLMATDPDASFGTILPIMHEYFPRPYPAATVPGVTWLSGFRFEIKAIAKLPEGGIHG
jgi:enamine deaminase RidA (YjgF/YER057c/UK114 family)